LAIQILIVLSADLDTMTDTLGGVDIMVKMLIDTPDGVDMSNMVDSPDGAGIGT